MKTETPSAWAVAQGRGNISDMAGAGAGDTRTALRPAMVERSPDRRSHDAENVAAKRNAWAANLAPAAARKAVIVAGKAAAARE